MATKPDTSYNPELFLEKVRQRDFSNDEFNTIERVLEFAQKAHAGQMRKSGDAFINHPIATAAILIEIGMDAQTIAAALLHDVLEDTATNREELNKEFGKEIANLVEYVTKVRKIKYERKEGKEWENEKERQENLRRLLLALAEDVRVIILRLADRLHNMQTVEFLEPERQKRLAEETLEIYAPIANRLGMGDIKGRLEDLAFPVIWPREYHELIEKVKDRYGERMIYIERLIPHVEELLLKAGIRKAQINGRAKHYYTLWQKLKRYEGDIERIYDLVAVRIIVPSVADCYRTLGTIHQEWKPLQGRIKDFIALPKPNGYRSLHTTVFCVDGKVTEFQIRTPEMHREAELGVAAHWAYTETKRTKEYREGKVVRVSENNQRLIKELRSWNEMLQNPQEFLEAVRLDALKNRIYVFTPQGDVIDLPEGSTPVDFAYAIHSDIGNHCAGAKVDGKMKPLDYQLQNGEMVEIIVSKAKKPSRDWLRFVKSTEARNKIRKTLGLGEKR